MKTNSMDPAEAPDSLQGESPEGGQGRPRGRRPLVKAAVPEGQGSSSSSSNSP